jgi:hypothetical protein
VVVVKGFLVQADPPLPVIHTAQERQVQKGKEVGKIYNPRQLPPQI